MNSNRNNHDRYLMESFDEYKQLQCNGFDPILLIKILCVCVFSYDSGHFSSEAKIISPSCKEDAEKPHWCPRNRNIFHAAVEVDKQKTRRFALRIPTTWHSEMSFHNKTIWYNWSKTSWECNTQKWYFKGQKEEFLERMFNKSSTSQTPSES